MGVSDIKHNGPVAKPWRYWFGKFYLKLFGWKLVGDLPSESKFVLIGEPHTTNWDLPLMIATTGVWRLRVAWMGKGSLFNSWLGPLMRALGGIPIDRGNPNGVVGQIAELFERSERLVLVMAVSGTRKRTEYWRSGFYWIAQAAKVPILCGFPDFSRKRCGMGLCLTPSGDVKADMDRIREFYSDKRGKYPEKESRIRLKVEDKDTAESN